MLDRMSCGELSRKHHIALRDAAGNLRFEECFTRDGFDGPYTIGYHLRRPHTHTIAPASHGWRIPTMAPEEATQPLAKRHFRSFDLPRPGAGAAPIDCLEPLLFNSDVIAGVGFPTASDPTYVANADGDQLFYIHRGGGTLRSALGDVAFTAGDYVFVPRALLHRFVLTANLEQYWLFFEFAGGMGIPKQWRNPVGQLRMDAPYCHRDFVRPTFTGPSDEGLRTLMVKRQGRWHGFAYQDSPLDLVGWDGTVYPWAFPILAFQPRVSSVHLPPTWHGTFAARGALVCSFVPRLVDFHPEAIPCPYPHSSPHCDEIIFYCDGNFTSRRGVQSGSISYHPTGIPHGPHPGAYERSIGTHRTDELAVMLDVFQGLHPTPRAREIEDSAYHDSFLE